ncbi:MAG TPA: ATP-dependent DNA ligase [Thermoanaerobaculia bacterium]|nr:ATP-dependent DNA ligase [Thermoanaerobaculia bacterium]
MLLADLVAASRDVAATRSRNAKAERLARLLSALAPEEVTVAVSYLAGEVPQGRIGVGPALLRKALPSPGGSGGGRGAAAEPGLTLGEVDATVTRIAQASGAGSGAERERLLGGLLARATVGEQELLARLLVGELRQGALESTMVDALTRAAGVPVEAVRRALMVSGDLAAVARAALTEGEAGLARFRLHLFRPLQPMLAQTADGVEEAIDRLGRAALEWKLDGARVQVHKRGGEVRAYSRQLNDVTAAVPEVVAAVAGLPADEVILDGEVLALRPEGGPHPFQVTMRRFGRRGDDAALRRELPLSPFFFDLLAVDGDELLLRPEADRSAALADLLPGELLMPRLVTADPQEAAEFLDGAIHRGHEGVMAKALDAPYEAGRRGAGWLKVKPSHTLDLVVLAAEWGNGRRRGWLSNLHLGARDPGAGPGGADAWVMLGKTFKGMTDEMLAWQTGRLQQLEVARDGRTVYVRPELVVEIAFNEVQSSPHYPAGLALRFARVKRYRKDKTAGEADTVETVRALHPGG